MSSHADCSTSPPKTPARRWLARLVALGAGLAAAAARAATEAAAAGAVDLDSAFARLHARALSWAEQVPVWIVAALVVLVAWWLGSRLASWQRLPRLAGNNPFLHDVLRQMLRAGVVLLGVVVALELAGATSLLGTVLGAAGVLGLAVSFALRDVVENYLASLLLSLRQPFAPDDHVRIDDAEGHVVRLTPRATILMTPDGNHLRVPNAQVFKARILNFTRNPKRRFEFEVGVGSDQPLGRAQALAVRTLCATPGVLAEPSPACVVRSLGDSNVVLACFGWVDQTAFDFGRTRSDAIVRVKRAFDAEGIAMPEPIYTVRWASEADAPAAASTAPRSAGAPGPAVQPPDVEAPPPERDPLGPQIAADRRRSDDRDLLSPSAALE